MKKILIILVMCCLVLIIDSLYRNHKRDEFEKNSGIIVEESLSKMKIELSSLNNLNLIALSENQSEYKVTLSGVGQAQMKQLEQLVIQKIKIKYFNYENKKCLVGIFKDSKMIIQGSSIVGKNNYISRPFTSLFTCEEI